MVTQKASEARTVLAEYRKTVKNKKKLEEIDEFEEHLDEVLEYIPNRLIKKEIRLHNGISYEISIYAKKSNGNL